MKKLFNYVLVFSLFFILKNNVFALTSEPQLIDLGSGNLSISYVETSAVLDDDGLTTNVLTNSISSGIDFSNHFPITGSSGFGHTSTGKVIKARGGYVGGARFEHYSYTDDNGKVQDVHLYDNFRSLVLHTSNPSPWIYSNTIKYSTWRMDFQFRLDLAKFNNTQVLDQNANKLLFNKIRVSVSDDKVYCDTARGHSFIFSVSCFGYEVTQMYVPLDITIYLDIGDDFPFLNSDYLGQFIFYFSDFSIIGSTSNNYASLVNPDSVSDNAFNIPKPDDYVDEFFSSNVFDDSSLSGLSQVILAPINFLNSLVSDDYDGYSRTQTYTVNDDPFKINFNVFSAHFDVPSGLIFWGRGGRNFKTIRVGSYSSTYTNTYNRLVNFRTAWNALLGGFLIYLSLLKLYKVCLKAISPSSEEVESL